MVNSQYIDCTVIQLGLWFNLFALIVYVCLWTSDLLSFQFICVNSFVVLSLVLLDLVFSKDVSVLVLHGCRHYLCKRELDVFFVLVLVRDKN